MQDLERYSRQTILESFGPEGQRKLKSAKVLIIGCGGLGVPVALYLNGAGVGTIGIMDGDTIALSNLHRQIIFKESDIGLKKAKVLGEFLKQQNSDNHIVTYEKYARSAALINTIADYDLVVDCTDNFESRYLINDACVLANRPLVQGAVNKMEGQVAVFNVESPEGYSGNYRDLFPIAPEAGAVENCEQAGVMAHLPGIIGTIMAGEVIKYFSNKEDLMENKLLIFDGKKLRSRTLSYRAQAKNRMNAPGQFKSSCKVFDVPLTTWEQLENWSNKGIDYDLIDVREINEHQIQNAGGRNIPLSTLNLHIHEFESRGIPLALYCQSGQRSSRAVHLLQEDLGLEMYSVSGGIKAKR